MMKGIVSLLVLFILLPESSPAESFKSVQKRAIAFQSGKNKKETGVARRKLAWIKNFVLEFKKEENEPKEVQLEIMEYQVTLAPQLEPVERMHGDFVIAIGGSREDQCRQRFSSGEFGADLVQCCEKGLIDLDSVITGQERNQCCPIIYSGDSQLEGCCKGSGDEVAMGLDEEAVQSCLATPSSAP